jgi:hypothetical protein
MITSTKSQAPSTKQIPITQIQNSKNYFGPLVIGYWGLFGVGEALASLFKATEVAPTPRN